MRCWGGLSRVGYRSPIPVEVKFVAVVQAAVVQAVVVLAAEVPEHCFLVDYVALLLVAYRVLPWNCCYYYNILHSHS